MRVGETTSVEVATGGDPQEALAAATFEAVEHGSINVVAVGHDPECPALEDGGLGACTCEILNVTLERVA